MREYKCPHCGSTNYTVFSESFDGDTFMIECDCEDCYTCFDVVFALTAIKIREVK